jgi:CBS domain-containing protein
MKKMPLRLGDRRKRAVVDTVRSVLEKKGGEIVFISPLATVYDAISEMAKREIGALLVISSGQLVGLVTERDYARKVILRGKSSKETRVREIMTALPDVVTPSQSVNECMRIMTGKRIRYLPVVDEGEPVGIVSMGDLVYTIISSQAYTIDQLHTYIGSSYPS